MRIKLFLPILLVFSLLFIACGDDDNDNDVDPERDIVEVASDTDNLSTFISALEAAELTETLKGEGPYTVFAPTDEAFDALPEGYLDELLQDPEGDLTQILLYHVVSGRLSADDILESLTTLQGEDISIEVVDGEIILNDQVRIVTSNIETSNGFIHIIDTVLIPPTLREEVPPPATVADIVETREDLSTLASALQAADLLDTLGGEGPFTLFAPTDAAFEALPEGTLDDLLDDPEGDLTEILLYHVVAGRILAEEVIGLESATTLQEEEISIQVVDGVVFLNENVQITVSDIIAGNGVVHLIDAVLIPPTLDEEEEIPLPSIADIVATRADLSILASTLEAADLLETLNGEGPFTLFAPTDAIFEALPDGTLEYLLDDPEGELTDILLYHVVSGEFLAEDIITLSDVTTLQGQDIGIEVLDGSVYLNQYIQVVETNIEAGNGVIHLIDVVLVPPPTE